MKKVVNIQSHNEETLLKLIKQGNDQAFTELYNRYWQKMLTIAFIKLQNTDDAKEVVQKVFIDIWNRRSHLNIRNSFYMYIATAVKYKVFTKIADRQKELQKRHGLSIDEKSHRIDGITQDK